MIAVPDRVADGDPPAIGSGDSSKAVHKVVVIQVKRSLSSYPKMRFENDASGDSEICDLGRNAAQVLGTKVVDLKAGRVVFWFIKRPAGKNVGFEFSFLQGAVAAIVILEQSDRETEQATKELLRDISKVFFIPVIFMLGSAAGKDLIDSEAFVGLGEIASKIVGFDDNRRRAVLQAS